MRKQTFALPDKIISKLEKVHKETGRTRQHIVIAALTEYLQKINVKNLD